MNDSVGAAANSAKKILVVDDTLTVAELIQEMLLNFGHQGEVCLTVEEALTRFEPGKYDLVITDYTMPRMNGVEFAKAIRLKSPDQLILLITGSTFSMADSAARQLPVNATLQKPFSVREFQQSLTDLFAPERVSA